MVMSKLTKPAPLPDWLRRTQLTTCSVRSAWTFTRLYESGTHRSLLPSSW